MDRMEGPGAVLKAHVALNVANMDESVEFYRRLFGIEPAKLRDGYAKFDVETPPLNFSLNRASARTAGALSHLGIQVRTREAVEQIAQRWRMAGIDTREEMQTNCCYALQDKVWARDPDGNEWEVFVVLEDNLEATSACCGTADLVSITLS